MSKVDVLAVMDRATGNLLRSRNQAVTNSAVEVREARAAVAELIEAARAVMSNPELAGIACLGSMAPCEDDLGKLEAALTRMGAA